MKIVWAQVRASKVSALNVRRAAIVPMVTNAAMASAARSVRQIVTVHFFTSVNLAVASRPDVRLIENVRRFSMMEVPYAVRVSVGCRVSAMLNA